MFIIRLKHTNDGQYRICLIRRENGKLVAQGEPIERRADAYAEVDAIMGEWNAPSAEHGLVMLGELPAHHEFPINAGPKKKG